MALNLAPFSRWTLRDKAAQRRLALRWALPLRVATLALLPVFVAACAGLPHYYENASTLVRELLSMDLVDAPIEQAAATLRTKGFSCDLSSHIRLGIPCYRVSEKGRCVQHQTIVLFPSTDRTSVESFHVPASQPKDELPMSCR
jgi:hypothetical protein